MSWQYLLSKFNDPLAFKSIISVLRDENKYVRTSAALALSDIGDSRAIEPLKVALMDDPDRISSDAMAEALVKLCKNDSHAVELLISLLKHKSDELREKIPFALEEFKHDSRAVRPLITTLKEDVPLIRWQAAYALGSFNDPRVVESLIAALKDETTDVRREAATALGKLRDSRAIEPLIAALKDEKYQVTEEAAKSLGDFGDSRAVEPLIALIKDSNDGCIGSHIQALGKLKDPRAIAPLIPCLKNRYARPIADRALESVITTKDPIVLETLIALLKDKNADVREFAAESLGKIKDPRAVKSLITRLSDINSSVREAAKKALDKIDPKWKEQNPVTKDKKLIPQTQTYPSEITVAIERIKKSQYATIPKPVKAPAAGLAGKGMTIENGTYKTLGIYFNGSSSKKAEVPQGESLGIDLVVGNYEVAAEVPDSKIIPFYGFQKYESGYHYRLKFYLEKR